MKNKIIITIISTILANNAFAIEETESLRKKAIQQDSYINIGASISGNKGNSDTDRYNLSFFGSKKFDNHLAYLIASKEFAKANDTTNVDKSFMHLRYNYILQKDLFLETFYQRSQNDFQALDLREIIGASLRYDYTRDFSFGLGLFDESEDYYINDEHVYFDQIRISSYGVYNRDINEKVNLSNTFYFQPNLEDLSDFRAFNKFKVTSELSSNLNMTLQILAEYDSDPITDVKKYDVNYRMGVEYVF